MTTSVTIKNNGPYRVNVYEVESVLPPREGKERPINSHTLAVGAEITLIWSNQHYLCVIETNDADTRWETLRAVGAGRSLVTDDTTREAGEDRHQGHDQNEM